MSMHAAENRPISANFFERVQQPIERARGLPNDAYLSQPYFEWERDQLFAKNWTCIGFVSDLPLGAYAKPMFLMGMPLLILKDKDESVRVFHNVCSHRGRKLVSESGAVKGVLRCPYHSWTYDLQGKLKGTPHIGGHGIHEVAGFNCANHGLKPVRSAIWMDMIFVNLSNDAVDFDEHIAPLKNRWAEFWGQDDPVFIRLDPDDGLEFELVANWKLTIENYCESYHLPWIHPGLNSYSKLEDHYNIMIDDRFGGQGSRAYQPPQNVDQLPQLDVWPKEKKHLAEYISVYPNALLGLQVDHLFVMHIDPIAPDRTKESLRLYYLQEANADKYKEIRRELGESWRLVFNEDIGVVEGMQAGRASPGFDGGVFSPVMDEATHHFHRWAANSMTD